MSWTVNPLLSEATNEHGYRLTWATLPKRGTWYNAWAPSGAHVDAGYDQEIVKAMCEMHREKLARDRAMYAAKKQATEVSHETI